MKSDLGHTLSSVLKRGVAEMSDDICKLNCEDVLASRMARIGYKHEQYQHQTPAIMKTGMNERSGNRDLQAVQASAALSFQCARLDSHAQLDIRIGQLLQLGSGIHSHFDQTRFIATVG